MAGDYICIDHELIEKPEVLAIHERTGVPIDAILGRLVMLWRLVDRQSTDGTIPLIGPVGLAQRCSGDAAFWEAIHDVAPGWLIINADGVTIPNFSERFGEGARRRMKEAMKKRRQRGQQGDKNGTAGGRRGGQCGTPLPLSVVSSKEETILAADSSYGFLLAGNREWYLPTTRLKKYQDAYGSIFDVELELKNIQGWLEDNAGKRSKDGPGTMTRITKWMNRTAQSTPPPVSRVEEFQDGMVFNSERGEYVWPLGHPNNPNTRKAK